MSVQLLEPLPLQTDMLPALAQENAFGENGLTNSFENSPSFPGLDNVSSQYPQQLLNDIDPMSSPASMLFGPLAGLTQFLSQMISQFLGGSGGTGNANGFNGEQYFNNANGASVGDPHLSFNGSTWNNMGSQPDLLNSDSFHGGYQLSTQTTAPNASGVTYNQSATVTTNFGGTQVTLDNAGNATVVQNGRSYPLQSGTSVNLSPSECVTRNQDGSISIACTNRNGGEITTTMRDNGQGVDVTTSANNVNLGGALVQGGAPSRPTYRAYD
jgi:hypothetical protein